MDLTPVIGIVHQNHESVMQNRKRLNAWREDAETMAKLRKVGGFESMMTLREAHYVMTGTGLRKPVANRILLRLLSNPIYRRVMGRRRANHRFDLSQHQ